MLRLTGLLMLLVVSTGVWAQVPANDTINVGFETQNEGVPAGWRSFGQGSGFGVTTDTVIRHSGKSSVRISCSGGCEGFKAIGLQLPRNYQGQTITLTGWVRTESVESGYAGLWMRIDPEIGFDNMNNRGIRGTTDWKQYSVTLKMMPLQTKGVVIGALLSGASGTMWVDDLEITIDGHPLQEAIPILAQTYPAQQDTVFATRSSVPVLPLDARTSANLKTLGLVWGFLKYYHPAIAEGRYNWDNELFRFLPVYLAVPNEVARDTALYGWVKRLGAFETVASGKAPDPKTVKLAPDLGWITASGFSAPLRDLLLQVQQAKRPQITYYLALDEGAQNPVFLHEIAYDQASFPDAGLQLLALYRYWNMVQYFFPYKNLIPEDWKSVLGEYIPKFIEARNDTAYTFVTQELIGRIHDSHANVWGNNKILRQYFGILYPAVELTLLDNQQLVVKGYISDSLGRISGLQPGDVVTHINGQPVAGIPESKKLRFPASNEAARGRDFAAAALRSNDSTRTVTYRRGGASQTIQLPLYTLPILYSSNSTSPKETAFRLLLGNIAYINNGLLRRDSLAAIWPQLKGTRALIIDDRNYPSDFPIHDFCNYLLPKPSVFYHATCPSVAHPGLFAFETPQPTGKPNKNYYKGKIAILVNEETQSSAEFHAMAYQMHPHAKVIGSTTAGADGNVSEIVLPGGIHTMFSGLGIYYPDGRETQRVGVAVDIVARPTAAGIASGKDEVLERALTWIASGK